MSRAGALLARAEAFAERHERTLSILATLWLAVTTADYAGFITLPRLPFLAERTWLILGIVVSGAWWGYIRPALERRRKRRLADAATAEPTPAD
ncbi:MAG TPA: hypothetical protein VM055_07245 [Novosphingobium sp.]|nr:hypothetical protein [Novosphingobium sp.]